MKTIGAQAFRSCDKLRDITISDGVTTIKDQAFADCESISVIRIPASVTEIPIEAFLVTFGIRADVYTTKGCKADQFFTRLNDGSNYVFTMHYSCDPAGHRFGGWNVTREVSCTADGIKERTCKICGSTETETIPATGHVWEDEYRVDKEATETEEGSESIHCSVCGNSDPTTVRSIRKKGDTFSVDAKFTLQKTAYNCTGNAIKPAVLGIYNGKVLVLDQDYTVKYVNNTDPGNATVFIYGIGKYSGISRLDFKIQIGASKKVTCTNVAPGMKVSWEKVTGATRYKVFRDGKLLFTTSCLNVTDKEVKYNVGTMYRYEILAVAKNGVESEIKRSASYYRLMPVGIKKLTNPSAGKMTVTYETCKGSSGYVVRYGLKSDMSDAKVITVSGENTGTRTFGGLKKGNTYFVQVRTYKIDNGVRYYSGYCTTKMIRITK